jgi:hypothetical protein
MEQNKDARPQRADPTQGEFEVGAEIREQGGGAARPDVAAAADAATDSSQAAVAGDNAGVVGDADDMTGGDSATHTPDDTAHRPMGLGSASGVDDATGSVSRSGQSR